jgi:hypothetical protein
MVIGSESWNCAIRPLQSQYVLSLPTHNPGWRFLGGEPEQQRCLVNKLLQRLHDPDHPLGVLAAVPLKLMPHFPALRLRHVAALHDDGVIGHAQGFQRGVDVGPVVGSGNSDRVQL